MATGSRPQLTARELAIINRYSARHGQVRGLELPIADVDGAIGNPLLRVPTLARLEQRGTISRAEAEAGARFHSLFQQAGLDTLHAPDMGRVPVAAGTLSSDLPPAAERSRQRVASAIAALGGHGSVAASAAWHVVGLEWSVARWATEARRPRDRACGILCAALGVLASHFAGRK